MGILKLWIITISSLTCLLGDSKLTIPTLFKNAFHVFDTARNQHGVYRDSVLLVDWIPYHPSSTAAIGMGLVSLCIADGMRWIYDARE